MKFSVLLPTRNGAKYLQTCIESVLNQQFQDMELIVSDNANTDNTAEIVKSFASDNRLKYYKTGEVVSVTENWNNALRVSSGDYVLMIGDDDYLLPGYFDHINSIIEKYNNQNISKILPTRIYFNGRKNLIKRCINNLIDNALKYGKKVNIELSKKNTNIFIKIEDDGPGIPENEYENVFKPFYKIDKGRAETKSSVGLGLSIASDIIRSHGGNIKLEKSSLNGLEARIFLPV